jgi:hypothetical protein
VRKLILEGGSPGNLKRNTTMRKVKQTAGGIDVFALIARARMSDRERQIATDALRIAEAFADTLLWVKEKAAGLGTYFLKPSMKH